MFQELSDDSLQEIVNNNELVFVQYAAGWCGNCRIMKPKFKKLAGEHENVPFVVIDAEKYPNSRKLADVNNLPTFAAFKDGKFVKQAAKNSACYKYRMR